MNQIQRHMEISFCLYYQVDHLWQSLNCSVELDLMLNLDQVS